MGGCNRCLDDDALVGFPIDGVLFVVVVAILLLAGWLRDGDGVPPAEADDRRRAGDFARPRAASAAGPSRVGGLLVAPTPTLLELIRGTSNSFLSDILLLSRFANHYFINS